MLGSFVCLLIGVIKPSVFSRLIKKEITRKKAVLIFGIAIIVFFILTGITAPKTEIPQTVKEKGEIVATNPEKNTTETASSPQPVIQETNNQPQNKVVETKTNPPVVSNPPTIKPSPAPSNPAPQYTYYSVVNVVDGDTIKININGTQTTLRLIGIDTPETVDPRKPVQCFGKEASNKAKELLSGKKVRIEKDLTQGELDKYGRTLAYVYREDGLFYNKYIIEQGYAHEYTYNTPYKYQSEFKAAEKSARENQLGLWSPTTCNGDTSSGATTTNTTPTQQTSGKYYTSSYASSKYYYPQSCTAWQSLSASYLKAFDTLEALLVAYPSRTLSPQCQ